MDTIRAVVAVLRKRSREGRGSRDSSWLLVGGLLIVAIGLIAGFSGDFQKSATGPIVLIAIGVVVACTALIVRAIGNSR